MKDQTLTLQVSGMLWERSLVMRDLETGTLWSHHLGRGMRGKWKGEELEPIPTIMTTWGEWRQRHPDSGVLALSRTARAFREQVWRKPGRFVYLVLLGPGKPAPAVPMTVLQKDPVRVFRAEGEDVLVTLSRPGARIQSFRPVVEDQVLTFAAGEEGKMVDRETGSVWDPATGHCLRGELQGSVLEPRPGMMSFRKAWQVFHPEGFLVKPE